MCEQPWQRKKYSFFIFFTFFFLKKNRRQYAGWPAPCNVLHSHLLSLESNLQHLGTGQLNGGSCTLLLHFVSMIDDYSIMDNCYGVVLICAVPLCYHSSLSSIIISKPRHNVIWLEKVYFFFLFFLTSPATSFVRCQLNTKKAVTLILSLVLLGTSISGLGNLIRSSSVLSANIDGLLR